MTDLPSTFDPSQSIIFLGSGFSRDCKNIVQKKAPTVSEMRRAFFKHIKKAENTTTTLSRLSSAAIKADFDMHKYLTESFTISETPDYIKTICSKKWLRVYTTNYDDAYEVGSLPIKPPSYSFTENLPKKIKPGTVVHLHGYIRSIDENKSLSDQAILDELSYAKAPFKETDWWPQFERDVINAKNVFFIGYSLSDIDIKRILVSDPELSKKVHFVVAPNIDDLDADELSDYGTVHPIGTLEYSDYLKESARYIQTEILPNQTKSVKIFQLDKDKKPYQPPSAVEVYDLFVKGKTNIYRIIDPIASAKYTCKRTDEINQCLKSIGSSNATIVSAWLGNGKTIFSYLLSAELSRKGYTVFNRNMTLDYNTDELKAVSKCDNPVIIYDGTPNRIELSVISKEYSDIKIVLLLRSGLVEARSGFFDEYLGPNYATVDINKLSDEDLSQLLTIANSAGIDVSSRQSENYIRDIIISAVDSAEVANKVLQLFNEELTSSELKKYFVSLLITSRYFDVNLNTFTLSDILNHDPYVILRSFSTDLMEFFSAKNGSITINSSVIAKFIAKRLLTGEEIIECVQSMIEELIKSGKDGVIPGQAGTLMRYQRISDALDGRPESNSLIEALYESLRNHKIIAAHPLYWLQYSFVYIEERIDVAEQHLQHAYKLAEGIRKFDTYQLDTQYLKLLLRKESVSIDDKVESFDDIISLIDRVTLLLGNTKHIQYVVKTLGNISDFVTASKNRLTPDQASRLREALYNTNLRLNSVDDTSKIRFRVQDCSDGITLSIRKLTI